MNSKELLNILSKIGSVYSNSWDMVRIIVENMSRFEVIEKSWGEDFKNRNPETFPLKLETIETWSTHDKGVDLKFKIEGGKLVCEACILDISGFGGLRQSLRFKAKLRMPDTFVKRIENLIISKLERKAESEYEKFLEQKRIDWVEEFKTKFIEECKIK